MGQVHIQPGGGGSVEAALSVRVYSERRYQLRQGKWVGDRRRLAAAAAATSSGNSARLALQVLQAAPDRAVGDVGHLRHRHYPITVCGSRLARGRQSLVPIGLREVPLARRTLLLCRHAPCPR